MAAKQKLFKLSYKINIMAALILIACSASVGVFAYRRVADGFFHHKGETALMMAASLASALDSRKIKTILRTETATDYYKILKKSLIEITERMPDIAFVYVMSMREPHFFIIYGQNPGGSISHDLGFLYPTEAWNEAAIRSHRTGEHTYSAPYSVPGYGDLVSGYAPVFDGGGNVVAIVGVDLPVHEILAELTAVRNGIILIAALFTLLSIAATAAFARRYIEKPLALLNAASVKIAQGDMDAVIPDIKTNDEIGLLSKNFNHAKVVLTVLNHEIGLLASSAADGDLSQKIDARKFEGGWRSLAGELNNLLEVMEEHNAELLETSRRAESASRTKTQFLATMSHEIRTPMNAVIGISQIELQKENLPSEYAEALEKIYSSGTTLLGIINDILDFSKIETGKLELNPVEYDVPSFINDAAQLNMVRIDSKPIDFSLEVDENLPAKLYGDELRLKQILNNLLSNAIKYTERGKVELIMERAAQTEDGVLLRIVVKDTGQGMRPEDLKKLFTEFARFNAGWNREIEGTGLGLSITKKLVEMMDGRIEAESEYGKGSTFTVTVRQKAASERGVIGRETAEKLHNFTFKGHSQNANVNIERKLMPDAKVLVVDDVGTNLYVAEGLLRPYKLKVETALSGFAAIEKVDSGETYDIIFMDQMMPRMNGIEAARRLRESGYAGAMIALTANALSGTREMFLENGFDDFLSKPIDIAKLDAVLTAWIPKGKIKDNAECGVRNAELKSKDNAECGVRNAELKSNSKSSADDVGVDVDVHSAFRIPHSALTIDGVDVKLGIARTGGKVAGYLRTLEVFCEDGRSKIGEIRKSLDDDDLPLYTIYVHALKSALANIGADGLSKRAGGLEDAGNRNDRAYIDAHTEKLLSALKMLLSDIDSVVSAQKEKRAQDQNHPKDFDMPALDAILSKLSAALNDLDPPTINETVKKLEPFENAAGIDDKIKQITRSVLNGDYDGAAVVIERMLAA